VNLQTLTVRHFVYEKKQYIIFDKVFPIRSSQKSSRCLTGKGTFQSETMFNRNQTGMPVRLLLSKDLYSFTQFLLEFYPA